MRRGGSLNYYSLNGHISGRKGASRKDVVNTLKESINQWKIRTIDNNQENHTPQWVYRNVVTISSVIVAINRILFIVVI